MKNNLIQFHKHNSGGKRFNVKPSNKNKVNVFSHGLSAGIPSFVPDDTIEETITLDEFLCINPEYTAILYVSGNSMEPELYDGQAIFLDTLIPYQTSRLEDLNGKIVGVYHNGTQMIKRLQVIDGIPVLVPDNPDFPRVIIKENDDFRIFGVLLYSLKAHY